MNNKKEKPVLGRDYKVAEGFPTFDSLEEFFKWETERNKDALEKIKKDNKISLEDDYEVCKTKLSAVVFLYYTHRLDAWNYFKSIFNDIPREYQKGLLMYIFNNFVVDAVEFTELLASCTDRSVQPVVRDALLKGSERVI